MGVINGEGEFWKTNGNVLRGEWRQGYLISRTYDGQLMNNQRDGLGIAFGDDGLIEYNGSWF
jgi:hypothetical protein